MTLHTRFLTGPYSTLSTSEPFGPCSRACLILVPCGPSNTVRTFNHTVTKKRYASCSGNEYATQRCDDAGKRRIVRHIAARTTDSGCGDSLALARQYTGQNGV